MNPNNLPPMPPNPNPNPNANSKNKHISRADKRVAVTVFTVIIVVFVIHLIISIFGIVDAVKYCKENTAIQILLLLFVPFYTVIYLFIRKSACPRTK